jgi:hypothetical protein
MDESYQEAPPFTSLAATSYQIDPNWYTDTGATDHITSDLDRLAVREQYSGDEQVQVSNGACLQNMHIGHCSFNNNYAMPVAGFCRQAPKTFTRFAVMESVQCRTHQTTITVCQGNSSPARNCERYQNALAARKLGALLAQTRSPRACVAGTDDGTPTIAPKLTG